VHNVLQNVFSKERVLTCAVNLCAVWPCSCLSSKQDKEHLKATEPRARLAVLLTGKRTISTEKTFYIV
jgi:hypothetical protein